MSKRTTEAKDANGPSVFRFKARLDRHSRAAVNGSAALIDVPKTISNKLRGMTKVEGTLNGRPFRAALESNASGGRSLIVNKAMRYAGGDTVQLAILGPEPAPTMPADLRVALNRCNEAKMLWKDLTSVGRRDWIRWVVSAKTLETRARRVKRTVEQLSAGKRRPCCVNVYEFMLSRVQE